MPTFDAHRCGTDLRRRVRVALPVALVIWVATSCLGPTEVDPTGSAPIGNLEVVVAEGDGIRMRGWAADPDVTAPVLVSISSEQRVRKVRADLPRPDVAAVHRALGPFRGFDTRYPGLAPGRRQICVWVDNVGRGSRGRLLGCHWVQVPAVEPAGHLESVTAVAPGIVRAVGWVVDPELSGPSEVTLTLNGQFALRRRAELVRPELGRFFGRDPRLGFVLDLPVPSGRHRICATALNVGWGSHRPAGCGDVDVPAAPVDRRPSGEIREVVPGPGSVRIRGVVSDPDGMPGSVRVAATGGTAVLALVTAGSFDATLSGLPPGPVRICVTVVDVPGAPGTVVVTGDRILPCATAVIGEVIGVGSGGSPSSTRVVGPPPGHPLWTIDRDAGVSVRLRDGSVLWLFGDSSAVDANGDPRYFVHNTAAWAAPGALTATRDAVGADGRPVAFSSPGPGSLPCPPTHPRPAMWPLSAVARPDGVSARDIVTAFMGNVCLGLGFLEILPMGTAVVEWTYDPAAPPDGRAVIGTVRNQFLFPPGTPVWGTAAVIGDDDLLYVYSCDGPADGGPVTAYGPCRLARVPAAAAPDRSAWRFWSGDSSWSADIAAAAPLTLPDGVDGYGVPVASLSVTRDVAHGAYVMAYSPWPGFTDRLHVRVATAPEGPWTAPVEVLLPGCGDTVAGVTHACYAGTTQPAFSGPGLLGLGYYDQLIRVGPSAGGYLVVSVPFTVALTA